MPMVAPLAPIRRLGLRSLALITLAAASGVQAAAADTPHVDVRQVRAILSDRCYACHGPDAEKREGGLRLDDHASALAPADSGARAIVPGKPGASELVRRITSTRPGTKMPPPDSNKTLAPAEIQLLKDWIAQGARDQAHWAFETPRRPDLPRVSNEGWVRNPIDRFILARLDAEKLALTPEADRATLVRRVTLDLTGLPPTPEEVDAFLADARPEAYERLVDRLLHSPRYGERMALDWLDAARYADTHGYHIDAGRDMTRWRDWVIDAFNRNLPYDRFTVEQLAGDLLPNATLDQKVASGFNRNHMITFEGGVIPEEYLTAYIIDRVNTTGTVWLGLTVACTQCHDHKYDPMTQKEFYQLYAFFNGVPEKGVDGSKGNAAPMIKAPRPDEQAALGRLAAAIAAARADLNAPWPEADDAQRRWEFDHSGASKPAPTGLPAPVAEALKVDASKRTDAQRAALRDHFRSRVYPEARPLVARIESLTRERAALDARIPTTMVMASMGKPRDTFLLVRGQYDKKGDKVEPNVPSFLPPLPADAPRDRLGLARWLVDPRHPLVGRVTVNRLWQSFFGTGLVRTVDDFGSQGEAPSHPELLDWLAVEFLTPADGSPGWDVKRLVRMLVTSAAYRQRSSVSPALVARDPENRLLARGPRVRLPAEFLRDQALAVSGLLNGDIGGKSVSPYQPAGLWEELMSREDGKNWSAQVYEQSRGRDLYRRTMYTFWKRTSPPPALATFDAPDRETCTVRRARTNTPLQALVLLNDPTYVEAARKLAERVMIEAGRDTDARIDRVFRLCTARRPTDRERAVLREVLAAGLARFRAEPEAARKLLAVGDSPRDPALDPAEHAAWTTVASVILNLDEVLNKN